eukprot:TRINITY_DN1806_c0_g1_i1.p1 TRINITY_DN1806_c0_g1~~TRINITY_DN1806_c0_g1_i1.p1  ORF type:complete len:484 (-),score=100.13 TRINITY_DN1806_c0_g1_i1:916-2367(-)
MAVQTVPAPRGFPFRNIVFGACLIGITFILGYTLGYSASPASTPSESKWGGGTSKSSSWLKGKGTLDSLSGLEGADSTEDAVPAVPDSIPGTRLESRDAVESFRQNLQCINQGEWAEYTTPRPLPWNPTGKGFGCDQDLVKSGRGVAGEKADAIALSGQGEWKVRQSLQYEWVTPNCTWERFDPVRFCRYLGPRNTQILVVGDSIQYQFFQALQFNLWMLNKTYIQDLFPDGCPPDWVVSSEPSKKICYGFKFCSAVDGLPEGPGVDVRFARNDFLTMADTRHREKSAVYGPWWTRVEEWNPDVVVLNRGAHWAPNEDYRFELQRSVKWLREKLPNALLIFRSTPAGHIDCMRYDKPLKKAMNPDILPYRWGKFPEQNAIAKEVIEGVGGVFMDVDIITLLRADGHIGLGADRRLISPDCLHYCLPGPEDTWVQLLGNILLQTRPPPPQTAKKASSKAEGGAKGKEGSKSKSKAGQREGAPRR